MFIGHVVFGQQNISNTFWQNVRATCILVQDFAVDYFQCGVDECAKGDNLRWFSNMFRSLYWFGFHMSWLNSSPNGIIIVIFCNAFKSWNVLIYGRWLVKANCCSKRPEKKIPDKIANNDINIFSIRSGRLEAVETMTQPKDRPHVS